MSGANPTFTVYVGPMFSSKTSKLLTALERAKYQHKRVLVVKPGIDDRYSAVHVCSHGGWQHPARSISNGRDLLEILVDIDVQPNIIAVDEAFMIPGIAETLVFLYRCGISIVVSTLDIGSNGKPFFEVEKMLPWATHIEKCAAVCTVCGKDAYYSHKKVESVDDADIQIGGAETYEPRCFSHHAIIDQRPKIHED